MSESMEILWYRLHAYYMSWHYFHQFSGDIRRAFDFTAACKAKAKSRMQKTLKMANRTSTNTVTVGIHNRQGDFAWADKRHFGHMAGDARYFAAAMTYFRRKYYYDAKEPLFLMFSEDYAWNVKHFGNDSDVLVMKPDDPVDDMFLLISCDELILSAGSYSWWTGYLHGGSVVISGLYARKNSNLQLQMSRDYYMPHWLVM